jgi:hypothetical protein
MNFLSLNHILNKEKGRINLGWTHGSMGLGKGLWWLTGGSSVNSQR